MAWASVLSPNGRSCARGSGRDIYEEPVAHNNQVGLVDPRMTELERAHPDRGPVPGGLGALVRPSSGIAADAPSSIAQAVLAELSGGEGFKPSSDETARNRGLRDRANIADLQVVFSPFASLLASQSLFRRV
jgi:hypothetical protein